MISAKFLWGSVLLGGKLQIGAKNSNFEIFESALYMKSVSMPLNDSQRKLKYICTSKKKWPKYDKQNYNPRLQCYSITSKNSVSMWLPKAYSRSNLFKLSTFYTHQYDSTNAFFWWYNTWCNFWWKGKMRSRSCVCSEHFGGKRYINEKYLYDRGLKHV